MISPRLLVVSGLVAAAIGGLIAVRPGQGDGAPAPLQAGERLPASVLVTPLSGGDPRPLAGEIVGVTVVNLFASWCAPCRAENPALIALRQDGVRVVGVAVRDQPAATQAFLDELGDPYFSVVTDLDGNLASELAIGGSLPQTFVVSASGVVLYRHAGPLVGTDGEAALQEIRELAGPR